MSPAGRIIETPACVAEGAAWLAGAEPRFAQALALTGPLPLRRRKDGFEALFSAIVSQQVSVAAADAIWGRLKASGLTGPRRLLAAGDEELRACGPLAPEDPLRPARSRPRACATARCARRRMKRSSRPLVEVPGIGRWTAEIYAMFSLGRADVFAPGDLALQEAARPPFRPPGPAVRACDPRHGRGLVAPGGAFAARLLWAYYRVARQREGIR